MIKGKKGASNYAMLLVVGVFLVAGLFAYAVFTDPSRQTAAPSTPESRTERAISANEGEAASYKVKVRDVESTTLAQESAPVTCWKQETPGSLLLDASVSSSTTTLNVPGVKTGDTTCCAAFNGSWYGDLKCSKRSTADIEDLDVHNIVSSMLIQLYTKQATVGDANDEVNISVSAGNTDSFDKLRVYNNNSNAAFNFKGVVLDFASTRSNVSKPTTAINGLERNTNLPVNLDNLGQADMRFDLPEAKLLRASQEWNSGSFTVGADGDGCVTEASGSGGPDRVTLRLLDEGYFKAVKGNIAGSVVKGVETDANSPADVGIAVNTLSFVCNT